uniref:Uncharacterized protein n=1 Tax=Dendrobium officinale TaxID=142615 RepID=A0A1S6YG53_DENOF|nr:hypothetical protein [Dendrobium officinale]
MPLMLGASSGLIASGVPRSTTFRCQFSPPLSAANSASGETNDGIQIGSPVVIVQAPPTLKTAVPMSSLKVNNGQVKADVWAIRLAIGTYLIDGKHFRPLDLDNDSSEAA